MGDGVRCSPRSGWPFWSGILVVFLGLYLLCWGPVAWLLSYWQPQARWATRTIQYTFYPHLWAMSRSRAYFSYTGWWIRLADPTFEEFPAYFEGGIFHEPPLHAP